MSDLKWTGHAARWSQEKKLASLHPHLAPAVVRILAKLQAQGFKPKIHYGWRSVKAQAAIKAKGRSGVSFSFHNCAYSHDRPCSLAADIIDKRWAWGPEAMANGFWDALIEASEAEGLFCGGRWKRPDWAHVQYLANSKLRWAKETYGGAL
jgi:peptidoglycan L-alanyl-D-glutamate endopeptidase CwlK